MQHFCFAFTSSSSSKTLRMLAPRPCTRRTCLSGVMAVAEHIVECFPFLLPPFQHQGQWPQPKGTQEQPWEEGIYHPYLQIWNEVITQCIIHNHSAVVGNTLYVSIQLEEASLANIKISPQFELVCVDAEKADPRVKVQMIFSLPPLEKTDLKMAIIATHPCWMRSGYPFSATVNMEAIFIGILYNNEQWHIYYPTKGEVVSAEELATYKGVILPGSSLCVNEMYPELAQILTNLDQALSLNKQLRVLGVCYGHQAVAYHYKVAVEQKPQTGGIERVVMSPHLKNRFDFLPEVLWEEPLIISEHHQDYVMGVPQGFLLLAGSESCEVEGLVREDGRILTVQFHSEFFVDYTRLVEERAKLCFKQDARKGFYEKEQRELQQKSMKHSQLMMECFKTFLRGRAD